MSDLTYYYMAKRYKPEDGDRIGKQIGGPDKMPVYLTTDMTDLFDGLVKKYGRCSGAITSATSANPAAKVGWTFVKGSRTDAVRTEVYFYSQESVDYMEDAGSRLVGKRIKTIDVDDLKKSIADYQKAVKKALVDDEASKSDGWHSIPDGESDTEADAYAKIAAFQGKVSIVTLAGIPHNTVNDLEWRVRFRIGKFVPEAKSIKVGQKAA